MKCYVCRQASTSALCGPCGRSYDRSAHREGTVMEAIRWAAERSWRCRKPRRDHWAEAVEGARLKFLAHYGPDSESAELLNYIDQLARQVKPPTAKPPTSVWTRRHP